MITSADLISSINRCGITHCVWLPDSTIGLWEAALETSSRLIRVCREGEAWAVAAGLYLGGAKPLVIMQCTGLFESGDSLRNAIYDYNLPLYAIIGERNALRPHVNDSARTFTEPILEAWSLDCCRIDDACDWPDFAVHYDTCQRRGHAGVTILSEGAM